MEGKTRAKQFYMGDREEDKKKVIPVSPPPPNQRPSLPPSRSLGPGPGSASSCPDDAACRGCGGAQVLLHGDAAFAGQGIVYETMQLAKVKDFANGGTIHVVVNNQVPPTSQPPSYQQQTELIQQQGRCRPALSCGGADNEACMGGGVVCGCQVGFTTDPMSSRSTPYCTDLGKAFDVPIFHCNGDDPLSVTTAFEMATDWRQVGGEGDRQARPPPPMTSVTTTWFTREASTLAAGQVAFRGRSSSAHASPPCWLASCVRGRLPRS